MNERTSAPRLEGVGGVGGLISSISAAYPQGLVNELANLERASHKPPRFRLPSLRRSPVIDDPFAGERKRKAAEHAALLSSTSHLSDLVELAKATQIQQKKDGRIVRLALLCSGIAAFTSIVGASVGLLQLLL